MSANVLAKLDKPAALRGIFALYAVKIVLSVVLYTVFTVKNITVGDVGATHILYTTSAYVGIFALMILAITKKNLTALRALMIADIAASLPMRAYIGILIGAIALGLSFNSKVKAYFSN